MNQFHEQSEAMLPAHEYIPQPTAWQSVPGAAFLLGAGFALS